MTERRFTKHLTVKQNVQKILELKKIGLTNTNIARRFGVSGTFIGDILKSVGRTSAGWVLGESHGR